jgi:hypothetical protein
VNTNGACEIESSEPSVRHDQGAPIDLASLPQLDLIEVGNGPLRLAFYGFGGVPFLPAPRGIDSGTDAGPFIDVKSGERCWPRFFADKTWRCVPSSFRPEMDFNLLYESEDCTGTRVHVVSPPCGDQARETRGVIVETLNFECGGLDYPVVETLGLEERSSTRSVSYRGSPSSSSCQRRSLAEDANLFRATKVLNPDEVFAPMERKLKD